MDSVVIRYTLFSLRPKADCAQRLKTQIFVGGRFGGRGAFRTAKANNIRLLFAASPLAIYTHKRPQFAYNQTEHVAARLAPMTPKGSLKYCPAIRRRSQIRFCTSWRKQKVHRRQRHYTTAYEICFPIAMRCPSTLCFVAVELGFRLSTDSRIARRGFSNS